MTIIQKLSDRGGFILDVIRIILTQKGMMKTPQLQFELLQCGIYIPMPMLKQAISVMIENKILQKPNETVPEQTQASVQPAS